MKKTKEYLYLHGKNREGATGGPRRTYNRSFRCTKDYRDSLPDLMQAEGVVEGPGVALSQVGIAGFRLPLRLRARGGRVHVLEARVSGTVSLAAQLKGINMSRIVRAMTRDEERLFSFSRLEAWLRRFRREAGSAQARVQVEVSYPVVQKALRSGLSGWQFYRVVFSGELEASGNIRRRLEFDFTYSSACPCSAELAEHARDTRDVYAIPHSQRSKARLWAELAPGARLAPEDLLAHCIQSLNTETQVVVRREDEQAFGELNGAHLKFVEDAARLLFERLERDARIRDFRVACAHFESLHNHDAVSVVTKGLRGGYAPECDWSSLSG